MPNKSLVTKFMSVMLATMLVIASIIIYVDYRISLSRAIERFDDEVQAQFQLVESALKESLLANDIPQIQSISDSLTGTKIVLSIEVMDANGSAIAKSTSNKKVVPSLVDNFSNKTVKNNGNIVGKYSISFSQLHAYNTLMSEIKLIIFIMLSLTLISLLIVFVLLKKIIINPVKKVTNSLSDIASGEGDLTQRLCLNSNDEIASLAYNFNRVMEQVSGIVGNVKNVTNKVNSNVKTMSSASENTVSSTNRQLKELEQVATALNELSSSAEEVANSAEQTAERTKDTSKAAQNSSNIVKSSQQTISRLTSQIEGTATKIQTLKDSSVNIGSVMEVIRSIAEQTNLLALNAAIEAARAGEQGRGFAVVADEVRSLAQKTQKSTEEIESIILELQKAADEAHNSMNTSISSVQETIDTASQVEEALDSIRQNVDTINDMNHHIASASQEQSAVANEVSKSISAIYTLSEGVAENAEIVSQSAGHLNKESLELKEEMDLFKI